MRKSSKCGFIFAMLMVGNAHAELLKVNLTGTVSSGSQGSYDYNYNTGDYNNSYSDLAGSIAQMSFLFDTSKGPGQSYSYSDSYNWGWGNYSWSESYSIFNSAISSLTGSVGGTSVSFDNASGYVQNYSWSSDLWGSGSSNGAQLSGSNYSYNGNSYNSSSLSLSNYGTNPVDVTNFMNTILTVANTLNFSINKDNWNYDGSSYKDNYFYANGAFNNISVSPVFGSEPAAVPVPAAVWLFGTALLGLLGLNKKGVKSRLAA